jgi:predicted permease
MTALGRRGRLDQDIEDEIAFHLAMKAGRDKESDNAVYAARKRFGNPTRVIEDCREAWSFAWVESVWNDVRHVFRMLRKSPVFALVAVLSLGMGIGANTAVFSVLNASFLRSLPVRDPSELRVIQWNGGAHTPFHDYSGTSSGRGIHSWGGSFSYNLFRDFQKRARGFASVIGFADFRVNVLTGQSAAVVDGYVVSGNFFQGLGAQPILGRVLAPDDDRLEAEPVAVISDRLWERQLGRNPAVIGATIQIDRTPYTVVGVLPPAFFGVSLSSRSDIYIPIARAEQIAVYYELNRDDSWWVQTMARRDVRTSEQQSTASIDLILSQDIAGYTEKWSEKPEMVKANLIDGRHGLAFMDTNRSEFLTTLLAIVGLILLIACANLANLVLARTSARSREIAIRLSIGAARIRLVRHLLTESLTLAALGGLAGVAIAYWGARALAATSRGDADPSLDLRVLGFAAGLCVATALLFGFVPALRATRVDLGPFLKQAGTGGGTGAYRQEFAKALIAVQVALSMIVLVGAGLFARTLVNLYNVNIGFKPDHLLLFYTDPSRSGYKGERLVSIYQRMEERLAAIPGVRSVAMSRHTLVGNGMSSSDITIPGHASFRREQSPWVHMVNSDFLSTVGIPVARGRNFSRADNVSSAKVAIVNETMQAKMFDGNATGRVFRFGERPDSPLIEVVGVAADARYSRIRGDVPPTVYIPYSQRVDNLSSLSFTVRTAVAPLSIVPAIRRAIGEIDPTVPVAEFRTQESQINQHLGRERTFAALAGFFGAISLILACIGLYGLLAYAVSRRTNEIGLRVALGAGRREVQWLVVRDSVLLVIAGIAAGVPAALAATKLIQKMLYGVEPADPMSIIAAVGAMAVVAAIAAWLPARRAARVDPVIALRYE